MTSHLPTRRGLAAAAGSAVLCALSLGVTSAQAATATTTTTTTTTVPATIKATSCAYEAVQAAVNGAQAGQTVVIPAGTCDWADKQLRIATSITLKGAGIDVTTLRRTADVPANTYLVLFDCYASRTLKARFSDMTLEGHNQGTNEDRGLGLIGGCSDFSVSHAKFTHFVFAGVEVRGAVAQQRGVIYKNQFVDNYSTALKGDGYGVVVYGGANDWPALELGTANAVFVEDNYMIGNRHHIASNNGARYVFRHNVGIATEATKDFSQVDAHGHTVTTDTPHGTRSWEIYDNQFSATISSGRDRSAIAIRGGDGIIARNTYGDNIAYKVELTIEGAFDTSAGATPCDASHLQDQTRQAYIAEKGIVTVYAGCSEKYLREGIEYFQGVLPAGYQPYTYPHPLRASYP